MRPILHPRLVNGRFGDPALFVEILHRREAILFDMGDLSALSARDLLRVSHVFVSHMHMDHFVGFDALLRVSIGRDHTLQVAGPAGLIDCLHHKLQGYTWDLADRYEADAIFVATEIGEAGPERSARFRFKRGFEREPVETPDAVEAAGLRVRSAVLEHHGPCLGYALDEPAHVNVWKVKVQARGLATGPWLQQLKAAVLASAPDDMPIALPTGAAPLGQLRDLVTVTRGQTIAYVTDVADTPANRAAIADLARDADLLFVESRFAAADREQAHARAHLTTRAAGEIAAEAGVRRVEPFHFSPRYEGEEERMVGEVLQAFEREAVEAV